MGKHGSGGERESAYIGKLCVVFSSIHARHYYMRNDPNREEFPLSFFLALLSRIGIQFLLHNYRLAIMLLLLLTHTHGTCQDKKRQELLLLNGERHMDFRLFAVHYVEHSICVSVRAVSGGN
jgi:hypothetical protein